MKDILDKLLTLSLELMETDRVRGDALWQIFRELEEKAEKVPNFGNLDQGGPLPSPNPTESSQPVTARGEGIFRGCTIQTVNIYFKEG